MEVLWSSGIVITGCHLTRSLNGSQVGTMRISYFTEEETEVPRGGLESYDHTESRWRGQDANPVCLSPGQNP